MSIEAMKLALEALEWDYVGDKHQRKQGEAITALRQAIEQAQKQEPVTDEENEKFSRDVSNFQGADPEATKFALEQFLKNRTPPQRQPWIGLTDDDKQIAFDDTQEGGGFWEFADAIEATLRKKNHG